MREMGGETMAERMATVEAQLKALTKDLDGKHQQNRTSIHNINTALQVMTDKFMLAIDALTEKLHVFDVNQARQGGYAAGAAAIGGIAVGIAMHFIDKIK